MEITKERTEVRWLTPVFVRIGWGSAEAVKSPRDAMAYLHFRWPARHGRSFDVARSLCAGAVDRNDACEQAREAFIRACIEADILD